MDEHETLMEKLKVSDKDYIFEFNCILTKEMIGKILTFDRKPGDRLGVTFSNQNCKMDGWRERWIHSCSCVDC